ncbi:MAG: helix-turn-helix domain-containing protein [Synergistales bacterium]
MMEHASRERNSGRENRKGIHYWRSPLLPSILFMDGNHLDLSFTKHSHETYAFGTVESGALGFTYRRETLVAVPKTVNLVVPGEVHDGHAASGQGWSYRMSYVSPENVREASIGLWGRDRGLPFIRKGVIEAPDLAALFRSLYIRLREHALDELEASTLWILFISETLKRHGEYPEKRLLRPDIHKAVEFLRENADGEVSLKELADLVSLSPWHFLRTFSKATGLTPHAYLSQARVRRAEKLLRSGTAPADAAVAVGFADQSHLTRWFRKILGTTPAAFRREIS